MTVINYYIVYLLFFYSINYVFKFILERFAVDLVFVGLYLACLVADGPVGWGSKQTRDAKDGSHNFDGPTAGPSVSCWVGMVAPRY